MQRGKILGVVSVFSYLSLVISQLDNTQRGVGWGSIVVINCITIMHQEQTPLKIHCLQCDHVFDIYIYIYTMRLYLSNNTLLVNTVHRLKSQALDNVNWITKYGHCKRQLSSRGLWILKIHILQWKVFSTVIASFVTYSFNKLCVMLFLAPLW